MAKIAQTVCKIFGVLFVLFGLAAFAFGDGADKYHNLLHFVTGLVALYCGFVGSRSRAEAFCLVFGVGYLAFGILGVIMGNSAMNRMWDVGPLHLSMGDHSFHIVLGAIFLVSGLLTGVGGSRTSTGRMGNPY